jgi:hypothetical protein
MWCVKMMLRKCLGNLDMVCEDDAKKVPGKPRCGV